MHIETLLGKELKSSINKRARLLRHKDRNQIDHHLTIYGATVAEVESALIKQNITYEPSDRKHSGRYNGHKCIFNSNIVYICVRDKCKNHRIRQKALTPDNLGLGGKTFKNAIAMKHAIISGLKSSINDIEIEDACISLLDAIDSGSTFRRHDLLLSEKSSITSDFGEVAGAYKRCINGEIIKYPSASNHLTIDYFANNIPISAKGLKGSNKISIEGIKSFIDKSDNTITNRIIIALADRDIFKALNIAAMRCNELKFWKIKLNGTISKSNLINYIKSNTLDIYITDVIKSQNGAKLGIPSNKYSQLNWEQYLDNPKKNAIMFTLLTFLDRYYSEQNKEEINRVIGGMLSQSTIVVEKFNYAINTNLIDIAVLPVVQCTSWKFQYWSNAKSPLNNWPGIKGE